MTIYTENHRVKYFNYYTKNRILVGKDCTDYLSKWKFFYNYFMSKPENTASYHGWHDIVSCILLNSSIQKILNNKDMSINDSMAIVTFIFKNNYRANFYAKFFRIESNPYIYDGVHVNGNIEHLDTDSINDQFVGLNKFFEKLIIHPRYILKNIDSWNIYKEEFIFYLNKLNKDYKNKNYKTSKGVSDKYMETFNMLCNNKSRIPNTLNVYYKAIRAIIINLCSSNKSHKSLLSTLYKCRSSSITKNRSNARKKGILKESTVRLFFYNKNSKDWEYRERL